MDFGENIIKASFVNRFDKIEVDCVLKEKTRKLELRRVCAFTQTHVEETEIAKVSP
jgi:hypothetical protein